MKSFLFLFLLIALPTIRVDSSEIGELDVAVFFGPIEEREGEEKAPHAPLTTGERDLTPADVGEPTILFGQLLDTGVLNLFYAEWYDGKEIRRRRFYVEGRPLVSPHSKEWVTVEATITKVDAIHNDKNEIRIRSFQGLTGKETQEHVAASAKSREWWLAHREKIDLNRFKKKNTQPVLVRDENWKRDFNELAEKGAVEIRGLDQGRGVIELVVSRRVIEEVQHHHGVFLEIVVIYDVEKDRPIRLLVRDNGYFLE